MYHFFVSYTKRENEVQEVYPLIMEFVEELKAAGFTAAPLFFDLYRIGFNKYYEAELKDELKNAIANSVCMISFVSPGYIESDWCIFEWKTIEMEKEYPLILPLIWKDIDWKEAEFKLNLYRLPESKRMVYPKFLDYFIPPRIKLESAHYHYYYPIEMHNDKLGLERSLRESYDFINSRTKKRTRKWRWIFGVTFLSIILTIITQIGGIILLVSLSLNPLIKRKIEKRGYRILARISCFLAFYLLATFLIVPIIAKPLGRVALPIFKQQKLKPLNFLTCLLNRHYVKPEMKEIALNIATDMNRRFPGTTLNYLEANFPFINGFPLIPHLSHNDGRKLDLAFAYISKETGLSTNATPSPFGYGICEEPRENETNTALLCSSQGRWQYSLLKKFMPQSRKAQFIFDSTRTKAIVNAFAVKNNIGKIFIEPHLKTRLHLTNDKIRFHGCQAVRHDDHIHVQLK